MRWTIPKVESIRVRKQFLLFPKTINGETRWLEVGKWVERFNIYDEWIEVDWEDKYEFSQCTP